ncbi:MAG: alpha/beta fold hydrolase [Clostridiales bacterium]|jgi:pimeloyl-ACP methyl ester carboxylesterase|nr:alpha/beta fold hydrolase [Clostridiales bacterium]
MKKKLLILLSAVLIGSSALSACSNNTPAESPNPSAAAAETAAAADPAATEDPLAQPDPPATADPAAVIDQAVLDETAETFMSLLLDKKYDECYAMFDAEFASQASATMLKNRWESYINEAGAYQNPGESSSEDIGDGFLVYDFKHDFKQDGLLTELLIPQATGKIAGIVFMLTSKTVPSDADDLPAGVAEKNITVGAGSAVALNGKLTYPAERAGAVPAVVLVHGNGSNGMDEVIGANRFFKQLAYALAQRGVAVLRYDKRTYADVKAVLTSINEEILDDAGMARQALLAQQDVALSGIYVLGHNFGAMFAPRIASESAFDGMISLSGTPRDFADYALDQSMLAIEQQNMSDGDRAASEEYLRADYENAKNVLSLSEEELQAVSYFQVPGPYFKSIAAYPASGYLETLEKPVLILQGGKDAQTSVEKDYNAYAPYAEANPLIEMKLYEGLNNLFMPSAMETPTMEEYYTPGTIDPTVLDDIANWLKAK